MALSTEDPHIDAHPITMPRNNEELDLFNVAQRQFLQAISVNASEADLKASLDYTLRNITDGANEEEEDLRELTIEERAHGRVRLEPELRVLLPRGRVYEKALERARNDTRVEKFLLMELERDADLVEYLSLNLPNSRRRKIAFWAATCNFVHMVVALLHYRDQGDREFCHRVLKIAVEYGYVELVERIPDQEEFAVNRGSLTMDFDDMYLRESGKPIERVDETGYLHYFSLSDKLTPLNLAAKLGKSEIVKTILAREPLNRALSPEGYWALYWAAKMGHAEVVDTILLNKDMNAAVLISLEKSLIEHVLANDFGTSFSLSNWSGIGPNEFVTLFRSELLSELSRIGPNDYATLFRLVLSSYATLFRWALSRIERFFGLSLPPPRSGIGPFCKVSLTPPQLALFCGHRNVVKLLGERLEHGIGLTDSATDMSRDEIREIVMDIPDIQKVVKRFEKERDMYVQAANSIIIVAALIGTVTFTVFLTPPPGYLDTSRVSVYVFYIYNSLSFFSAMLTLLIGSSVTRPQFKRTYIAVIMPLLRNLLSIAYNLLYFSVAFFVSTFLIAGCIAFPPFKVYPNFSLIMAAISSFTVLTTAILLVRPAVTTLKTIFYFYLYGGGFFLLIISGVILALFYP
jgi:hypothetical protein